MYAFARRPKWLVAHGLVLVLLVTFIGAGVWQWNRHQERSEQQEAARARQLEPPLSGAQLSTLDPAEHTYRQVEVRGTWRPQDLVRIRNRSQAGLSGCHVALPLAAIEGGPQHALLVVLGWLDERSCTADAIGDELQFPQGSTTVMGRLRPTQTRGALGPRDAAEGRLESLARTDVERIDQQVEVELVPMYAELISATPAVAGPIVTLDPPPTDNGPHLGYAVQWFLFFGVGAIGYPIVLRRQAQRGYLEDLDDVA